MNIARRTRAAALASFLFAGLGPAARADQTAESPRTTLTVAGILAWAAGSDDVNPGNPSQIVDGSSGVNLRVGQRFTQRWTAYFVYDTDLVDNTAGRTYAKNGAPKFSVRNRDWATEEQIGYAVTPSLHLLAGNYYHARRCCPGAGDPANPLPAVEQGQFVEADYLSPALTRWGLRATSAVHANAAHHVPPAIYLEKLGYRDRKRTEYGVHQSIGAISPIPHSIVSVFGSFTWGALDYYNNAPFPFYYTSFDYGLKVSPARNLSFELLDDLRTQRPQGYPNPLPQAIHRPVIDFVATYELRVR